MKIVIPEANCRERIERRHCARSAECAWLSEADVVEQNDDDVRRPLGGLNFKARRRLGITSVKFRNGWGLRFADWEQGPIDFLRALRWRERCAENEAEQCCDIF